ncbi:uncharacterized protein LOC134958755 [Pseudophryne corroboree]|uniref:uncharacterized protein LOC134958755 n=1 Tax=Pseudophryne corroboree TaxID=495146 RepID=UPI0030812605
MMLITVFMLVAVTLSQGTGADSVPDPKCVAQPGDKSACLSITFVKTGKLVTALQSFLCACPENAGQAFNFQEFKKLYFALKAELACVGCDVNILLGTGLKLEDLLSSNIEDVDKLTSAVNKLLGGLNLGGVVKLLCKVVTALNTPCVQDLLQTETSTDVTGLRMLLSNSHIIIRLALQGASYIEKKPHGLTLCNRLESANSLLLHGPSFGTNLNHLMCYDLHAILYFANLKALCDCTTYTIIRASSMIPIDSIRDQEKPLQFREAFPGFAVSPTGVSTVHMQTARN